MIWTFNEWFKGLETSLSQKSFHFYLVRPLFDPILALVWSLILMRFVLNLIELGSNYLPLLLIVPKMRLFFISGEITRFRQKRRLHELFQWRFKVRGSSEHQEEQSRAKQGKARTCDKSAQRCTQGESRCVGQKSGTGTPYLEARPCCWAWPGRAGWHDRATVRGLAVLHGTAVPWSGPLRVSRFSVFLYTVFLHFWGLFSDFFRADFREKLSLA